MIYIRFFFILYNWLHPLWSILLIPDPYYQVWLLQCVNYAGGAAQSEEVPNSSISSSASVAERRLCLALCYVWEKKTGGILTDYLKMVCLNKYTENYRPQNRAHNFGLIPATLFSVLFTFWIKTSHWTLSVRHQMADKISSFSTSWGF